MVDKSYKSSGVDLAFSDNLTEKILSIVGKNNELKDLGFFSSSLKIDNSIAVSGSVDGVGTKSKIFKYFGNYSNLGHDIVNHCVNDILPSGAKPFMFLDYLAFSEIKEEKILDVVRGISEACKGLGCILAGGETAQMPDIYKKDDLEVVGFILGIVEKSKIPKINTIKEGDILIGIPSNGLHTNGYSLVRKIFNFESNSKEMDVIVPGTDYSLGEMLTKPHRNYYHLLWEYLGKFKSIAHITGGGIGENVSRSIPDNVKAKIDIKSWERPKLFEYIKDRGDISLEEMFKVFNMGIGMVIIADPKYVDIALNTDKNSKIIGKIFNRGNNEEKVNIIGI
ncbi:MAG: phosphoribosylformylglycinamidine cyclo-ligase [Chloroflexota bacterium]|nr:phosphoribosylformylglycinamidine cyclo-ligase [Chloroflexota bacterium]